MTKNNTFPCRICLKPTLEMCFGACLKCAQEAIDQAASKVTRCDCGKVVAIVNGKLEAHGNPHTWHECAGSGKAV